MKKITGMIALLLMTCGLAGCFQIEQVITLSPDGSGTVEETIMLSRRIAESISAFADGMDDRQEAAAAERLAKKEQNFFKDDEILKRGENFGSGVRFVKMERLANKQFEGYRAVYAFSDINKLHLEQGSQGMPKQMGQGSGAMPKGTEFVFTPGETARLVVKQPKTSAPAGREAAETPSPAGETSDEELAMVRQMFDGLRISTTLVIRGKVIDSNATHRTGATIILTEVDFRKILDKPEMLAKMAAIGPGNQAAAMEMIKNMPGMKIDMNDEMRVSFR